MRFRKHWHGLLAVVTAVVISFSAVITSHAESVEETIFDYLVNRMGFNSAAACGILANIEKESAFNPTIYGDNGTSYGICQWHNTRFTNLRTYCDDHSLDYTTLEGQLEFLNHELSTLPRIRDYLHSVEDTEAGAYDAAYYWCYYFEIPANRVENSKLRGELAKTKYWPVYGGSVIDEGPFEVWQVTVDKLNVRTGPGTSYTVSTSLTRDTQVHITEIRVISPDEIWGKSRIGWSSLSHMSYVSDTLFAVNYRTGCASKMPSVPVHFRQSYVLPDAQALAKYGHTFRGWSIDGAELSEPGSVVEITGDVTVSGVWERDLSVQLILGDANCDANVNALDITAIMKYLVGYDTPVSLPCADMDRNGNINARDITSLMKVILQGASVDPVVSAEDEARW